jgi:hypothetical protein
VAEEPGQLDRIGDPEVGVDSLGTVCDGHAYEVRFGFQGLC